MRGFTKKVNGRNQFIPTSRTKSALKISEVKDQTSRLLTFGESNVHDKLEYPSKADKKDYNYIEGFLRNRKKETLHTIENNVITKGSPMYEEYLEKYPDSSISRDVRSFGHRGTHGDFGYNMMIGDYGQAWRYADFENEKKMLELGFGTKFFPEFTNELTPKMLHEIVNDYLENQNNTTRDKKSIDQQFPPTIGLQPDGTILTVSSRIHTCPTCHGKNSKNCKTCKGEGRVFS